MAASTTPISSYGVQLMKKGTGSTYEKLVDITSFPDMGGTPETLETTTTSDAMTTYILGIQQLDALTFEANYIPADYTKLKALERTKTSFAVWFGSGKDGADGKFIFDGYLGVNITGGGVNEVIKMNITIAPTTEITQPTTST